MRYTIENEFIRLTVDSLGAEMVSAIDLATGSEMIWCADPAVWNRHAPILFPLRGQADGRPFQGGGRQNLRRRPARLRPRHGACPAEPDRADDLRAAFKRRDPRRLAV